jgi:hypothetical protein
MPTHLNLSKVFSGMQLPQDTFREVMAPIRHQYLDKNIVIQGSPTKVFEKFDTTSSVFTESLISPRGKREKRLLQSVNTARDQTIASMEITPNLAREKRLITDVDEM